VGSVEFILTGGASERTLATAFSIRGIKQVLPHAERPSSYMCVSVWRGTSVLQHAAREKHKLPTNLCTTQNWVFRHPLACC